MKKIHIKESKLNEIYTDRWDFEAGTDHPHFEDEKTGEVYEANWNEDYGFPFGFWPIDTNNEMKFSIGDAWTMHTNACGKCAEMYFNDYMSLGIDDEAYQIAEALEHFVDHFSDGEFRYDEETDYYVSADGSEEYDHDSFCDEVLEEVYDMPIDCHDYVSDFIERVLEGNATSAPSSKDVYKWLTDNMTSGYDFTHQQGIDNAMRECGLDFWEYFGMGNSEGRIWPEKEMIGFYPSEQPDPEHLEEILGLLSQQLNIGLSSLYQYNMVFEDWRNDGTITACTVQDYIDGNYGPESYEDLDDEDDTPIQYNNGQKTVFVPHLANQQDKFNYYRDFRNTRDRAVYAPQERAAGNLAAYHAMRYPYGESKDKIGKIIREVIDDTIKMGD